MMTTVRYLKYVVTVVGMKETDILRCNILSGINERENNQILNIEELKDRRIQEGRMFFEEEVKNFFKKAIERRVMKNGSFEMEGLIFEKRYVWTGSRGYYKIYEKRFLSKTLVFSCHVTFEGNRIRNFHLTHFLNGEWREKFLRAILKNDELWNEYNMRVREEMERERLIELKNLGIDVD